MVNNESLAKVSIKIFSFYLISLLALSSLLCSCTYSVILTDTHGTATDVVDETSTPTADIKPNINVTPSLTP